MKSISNLLGFLGLPITVMLFASAAGAGPMCDQLAYLQRQEFSCEGNNQSLSRSVMELRNQYQIKINDINQSPFTLNTCQSNLSYVQSQIPDAQQQLQLATQAANQAASDEIQSQGVLDRATRAYECVGMDQKYVYTFRTYGATEAEARARLASPSTAGMSATEITALNNYLSMSQKHGVNIFCQRNYLTNSPGQSAMAATN